MKYAKILVGEHTGKTVFIESKFNDNLERIEVQLDGINHIFHGWEYEFVEKENKVYKIDFEKAAFLFLDWLHESSAKRKFPLYQAMKYLIELADGDEEKADQIYEEWKGR